MKVDTDSGFCAPYQGQENTYDEMCLGAGQVRPHWQYLIDSLNRLGREELERRWQEARRLLRDNGVTYNIYGDPQGQDRPWQLDPIPLLITSEEWGHIERGVSQRAELMSLLLADLYGPRKTIRKGLIPIELIATHPGFLRPCYGIEMRNRQRLLLYAVDLVRTQDGVMWAIADRTQAPSGAGYALENRIILSRVLPSLFRDSQVHRLSLFFRTLRTTLTITSKRKDPLIVLLTPGPDDEAFFEHAYLANYLGYTLVQGADLTVRDGKVCLKTLGGLQPIDVILRRLEDSACDPLELRPDSITGVSGLVQAVRMGQLVIANSLGTGVLENPGLMPFLQEISKYFLGEELQMPSPPTWWCGQRIARNYVLENIDKLVIKRIAPVPGAPSVRGNLLTNKQRDLLREQIRARPHWFVGSEELSRSTTPVFANGRLEPRQMILRSFLVRGEDGYVVMPGGLTRVSSSTNSPIFSNQSGGLSKDTWVLASEPEKQFILTPVVKQPLTILEGQRELPSRVAENLFWLGRYAERAEGTVRLLRVVLYYLAEPHNFPNPQDRSCLHSLLRAVTYLTETYPGFVGDGAEVHLASPESELLSVFLDKNRVGSLSFILQSLLYAARATRDRLAPDMWRVIRDIDDELAALQRQTSIELSDALIELDNLITTLAAFSGLSIESMTHGQGWRFLIMGRRLERAQHTVNLLRATLSVASPDDAALLEYLLTITDSVLTYRRRYRSQLQLNATLELILQDESNPRAIGHQLAQLQRYINNLPHGNDSYRAPESRLILESLTLVRLADIEALAQLSEDHFRKDLDQLLVRLGRLLLSLSDSITNSYFSHAERPRQLVQLGNGIDV
ncbi:MAG: hypothetical protein BWK79_11300 [Beggiatoa sp. IS2]|nr:MAG: hypothetical protein BWK79_11300 [Beggiatoa sp. IS2]